MLHCDIILHMTTSFVNVHFRPAGLPGSFHQLFSFGSLWSLLTGKFAKSCNVCEPCREGTYTSVQNSEDSCFPCFRDCLPSKKHFASFSPQEAS